MNSIGYAIRFALLSAVVASADKIPIAVSDLLPQGIDQPTTVLISDRLRSALFETGRFAVMERGQMDEVLKEQGFQQSGCVSDACAIEVGQMLGVTHIVVGSIGQVGKTYTANTRLLEVRTGKVVATVSTDCKCAIDDVLKKSTREVATAIASKIMAPEVEPAAATPDALDKAESAAVDEAGTARRRKAGWAVRIASGVADLRAVPGRHGCDAGSRRL
jgi:TolB-like protein